MFYKDNQVWKQAKEWLSNLKPSKQVVRARGVAIKNLCFHHRMSFCRIHTEWINPCILEFLPKIKQSYDMKKLFIFYDTRKINYQLGVWQTWCCLYIFVVIVCIWHFAKHIIHFPHAIIQGLTIYPTWNVYSKVYKI